LSGYLLDTSIALLAVHQSVRLSSAIRTCLETGPCDHVAAIHDLPAVHQDPFDRALIAQAIVEDLTLLTTDAQMAQYASTALRVVR
jgi:PIN domain nuclease of toxin-antitoxin system